MNRCRFAVNFLLAGCSLLVVPRFFGQGVPDPWLILASGESGSITAHTTREDLVRTYGASNVVDKDVDIGEGETEAGTVLFPKDAQRTIDILWNDPAKKTAPKSATIRGDKSRWHAAHGISLGTSLKQLERLNGQPFQLAGFEWDYPGAILSWEKGLLAADLDGGHGRVLISLDYLPRDNVTDDEHSEVAGSGPFSSHHPVMQKLNPIAYKVTWEFPRQAQD